MSRKIVRTNKTIDFIVNNYRRCSDSVEIWTYRYGFSKLLLFLIMFVSHSSDQYFDRRSDGTIIGLRNNNRISNTFNGVNISIAYSKPPRYIRIPWTGRSSCFETVTNTSVLPVNDDICLLKYIKNMHILSTIKSGSALRGFSSGGVSSARLYHCVSRAS